MKPTSKKTLTFTSTVLNTDGTNKKLIVVVSPKPWKQCLEIAKAVEKMNSAIEMTELLINKFSSVPATQLIDSEDKGFKGVFDTVGKYAADMYVACSQREDVEPVDVKVTEE